MPVALRDGLLGGWGTGRRVMEFRLDEGQVELQQTVTRSGVDRFPVDSVVAREVTPVARPSGQGSADHEARSGACSWPTGTCR